MNRARLILVLGLTGAGKTTYCDHLEEKGEGHSFSIDRWMRSLYWQEMPESPSIKWFKENQQWYIDRISRCEALITIEVSKLLSLGVSCILDLGFTSVDHRRDYINLGEQAQAKVELHFLKVCKTERWKRVQKRNSLQPSTYSMDVDEGMFSYMETIFEPITEEEKVYLHEPFSY